MKNLKTYEIFGKDEFLDKSIDKVSKIINNINSTFFNDDQVNLLKDIGFKKVKPKSHIRLKLSAPFATKYTKYKSEDHSLSYSSPSEKLNIAISAFKQRYEAGIDRTAQIRYIYYVKYNKTYLNDTRKFSSFYEAYNYVKELIPDVDIEANKYNL